MLAPEEALNDDRTTPSRSDEEKASASPSRKVYEPPRIVRVENVHDLVAGGVGSRPDARGRAVFS